MEYTNRYSTKTWNIPTGSLQKQPSVTSCMTCCC